MERTRSRLTVRWVVVTNALLRGPPPVALFHDAQLAPDLSVGSPAVDLEGLDDRLVQVVQVWASRCCRHGSYRHAGSVAAIRPTVNFPWRMRRLRTDSASWPGVEPGETTPGPRVRTGCAAVRLWGCAAVRPCGCAAVRHEWC